MALYTLFVGGALRDKKQDEQALRKLLNGLQFFAYRFKRASQHTLSWYTLEADI